MKILNVEDDAMKHVNICKVLKSCGETDVVWAKTLEEGLQKSSEEDFDLFILDMWFPRKRGTNPAELGLEFIQEKEKSEIPIIVCSSVKYHIKEALGCVHYCDYSDWVEEMRNMVFELKQRNS